MQRIFIISFFFLKALTQAYGQVSLNDSLLAYEYAYFKSTNEDHRQNILLQKIDFYLQQNITDQRVTTEIRRINKEWLNVGSKKSFLWNAAVIFYLNEEVETSASYLRNYEELTRDTTTNCYLLSVLINKYQDTSFVAERIVKLASRDTLFRHLDCFLEITKYEKKHLNFYLLSSVFLPGSGTAMNGEVLKGFVSLALTAGSVYGIVQLVNYGLYINAALWGTGVGLKFYTGNIKLTETTFYKSERNIKNKLAMRCELDLQSILKKYPLTLKR